MPKGIYKRKENIKYGMTDKRHTKKTKDKIRKSLTGRKTTQEHCNNLNKANTKDFKDVTVSHRHRKIYRKHGKPTYCELNKSHKSKIYDWANINHKYNESINEWIRLCRSCHILFDRKKDRCIYNKKCNKSIEILYILYRNKI